MSEVIRCCFAGHSDMYNSEAKNKVKKIAEELIVNNSVNEFWVGNYGSFDGCAGKAIRELKEIYPHIELDLVIPYLTKGINEYKELYYQNYDNIIVADIPITTPKRFRIIKANEYMVDNSKFLICYVERSWGGAVKTLGYAKRKKLNIFNIAE